MRRDQLTEKEQLVLRGLESKMLFNTIFEDTAKVAVAREERDTNTEVTMTSAQRMAMLKTKLEWSTKTFEEETDEEFNERFKWAIENEEAINAQEKRELMEIALANGEITEETTVVETANVKTTVVETVTTTIKSIVKRLTKFLSPKKAKEDLSIYEIDYIDKRLNDDRY